MLRDRISPGRSGFRATRRAFTLVEMLIVVLILSILMAVAMPLYLSAITTSEKRTARSNLHTLINASQAYRLRTGAYTSNSTDLLQNELNNWPVGPGATAYTLYTTGNLPDGRSVPTGGVAACANDTTRGTDGDYGCFIPGVDHD